ncbi:MAG: hypothetical protein KAV68_03860 [Dehalococcoidales bacterium]|nr:hypothetical protein [Dehalococcoidales bacterium]
MTNDQPVGRWFIDLDWLEQNNRSFLVLARGCLCPKCRERLGEGKGEISAADLLANIRDCCSQTPGFITDRLPILESVFRLFLANGNQPLDLEELGEQLSEWRGDTRRTSVEVLSRLLKNERYYGLRQVA